MVFIILRRLLSIREHLGTNISETKSLVYGILEILFDSRTLPDTIFFMFIQAFSRSANTEFYTSGIVENLKFVVLLSYRNMVKFFFYLLCFCPFWVVGTSVFPSGNR